VEPMTKEELEKLYHSMTNTELCEKLGVSKITLISALKRHGIPLKSPAERVVSHKIKIVE